jgi:hypothetical protein
VPRQGAIFARRDAALTGLPHGEKGWVGHDQMERVAFQGQGLGTPQVSFHNPQPFLDPVERGIATRQRGQRGLKLHPDKRGPWVLCRERQRDHSAATAEIEHPAQAGTTRKVREHEGVLRHARAPPRLQDLDATPKESVQGLVGAGPELGRGPHPKCSAGSRGLMTRPLAILG